MRATTIPMPPKAECPGCLHRAQAHSPGSCLVEVARVVVIAGGVETTTIHLCGCSRWQGPRPWLGEGPAWAREYR